MLIRRFLASQRQVSLNYLGFFSMQESFAMELRTKWLGKTSLAVMHLFCCGCKSLESVGVGLTAVS